MKKTKIIRFLIVLTITTSLISSYSLAHEEIGPPLDDSAIEYSVDTEQGNSHIHTAYEDSNYEEQELELSGTITNSDYKFRRVSDIDSTHNTWVERWADISPVQQFLYKNQGLAYAYVDDTNLHIVTPTSEFSTEKLYPILGDVVSDDSGNFYVVWGKNNEADTYGTETVFISKYSDSGNLIKTTGFVGTSVMGENGNTKEPFNFGGCDSVIYRGCLIVNYARTMYNGHQSNNVVGVYTNDMTRVAFGSLWDIPYTSHSFNQKVIWSDIADNFVYADHGDAYGRGFIISLDGDQKNIFHFYLPSNANYDMYIVNETFAQLGGLDETSEGVVLAGASVKSIGESSNTEKQNLFVQIFDPTARTVSKSMFVGGTDREGETSFDINDNENTPLESVTDYGVHWLTNYTEKSVVSPQMVVCNDEIVLLWSTTEYNDSSYYIVLSSDGEIIQPIKELKGVYLNSYEDPISYNGEVYWAYSQGGTIRVVKLGEILKGDLFTDGLVNAKDSVKLTQYLAKWKISLTDEEKKAADIVTDGLINSKDSIKLAQYLAKWNVTLD